MENLNLKEFFNIVDVAQEDSINLENGTGYGYGTSTSGDESGVGYGQGTAVGNCFVNGDGYCEAFSGGIKSINGDELILVDGIYIHIEKVVSDGILYGYSLNEDFTTKPLWAVKGDNYVGIGITMERAEDSLFKRTFRDTSHEERIAQFVKEHPVDKPYSNADLIEWHHKLTASCRRGIRLFLAKHGITRDGYTTVSEFIRLTENDFGGDIIKKLKDYY